MIPAASGASDRNCSVYFAEGEASASVGEYVRGQAGGTSSSPTFVLPAKAIVGADLNPSVFRWPTALSDRKFLRKRKNGLHGVTFSSIITPRFGFERAQIYCRGRETVRRIYTEAA